MPLARMLVGLGVVVIVSFIACGGSESAPIGAAASSSPDAGNTSGATSGGATSGGTSGGGSSGGTSGGTSGTPPPSDGGESDAADVPKDSGRPPPEPVSNPQQVSCGNSSCSVVLNQTCCVQPGNNDPPLQSCTLDPGQTCNGSVIACDEALDCSPGSVCCAEGQIAGSGGNTSSTSCRQNNCIGDRPRVQVCKTDRECFGGSCKAYQCRGGPPLFFCQRPQGCR